MKYIFPLFIVLMTIGFFGTSHTQAAGTNCDAVDVLDSGISVNFVYYCNKAHPKGAWDIFPEVRRTWESVRLPNVISEQRTRDAAAYNWRPDGCSAAASYDWMILTSASGLVYPSQLFQSACNEHDYCYAQPGASKQGCDDAFLQNLQFICRVANNGPRCYEVSISMYSGVFTFGWDAYHNAQNWARRNL